ncbi:ribosome maturation factor RimM [Rhizosphaericola mali]|uniref:Ribosome maturation factor RimM n=1 Tax=Rhizosphaericola mali TaxID=2545455 RepID=A0A5P2G709_9BACT|nr:ribosome maturation factor RimM [Rhizosphaericola mali]QES89560.1 16S rRNA processing protein RimM [Rhizosphaericola mali]
MDYIEIGKIVGTHGINGEVVLAHALSKKLNFKNIQALFIENMNKQKIPWFVLQSNPKNTEETILKFEEIETKEAATPLLKKKVWLTQVDFEKLAGKNNPISLIGYQLWDNKTSLAPIEEIIDQPHQVLARITLEGKEVLIPLHKETIIQVDHQKKEIITNLPDGLLEVYLAN